MCLHQSNIPLFLFSDVSDNNISSIVSRTRPIRILFGKNESNFENNDSVSNLTTDQVFDSLTPDPMQ